jgi:hypothetical protein
MDAQLICDPEQASLALRGNWASRANRRALCDERNARMARYLDLWTI